MAVPTILDNRARYRQAIGAFWAVLLLSFACLGLSGFLLTTTLTEMMTTAYGLLRLAQLVAILLTIIFFLRWLRRAYANLNRAGLATDYSDGWAVGAWFVPFLNLVRPYAIVRETWRGTSLLATDAAPGLALLRWWWGVFLFDGIARQLISLLVAGSSPEQQWRNTLSSDLISMPLLMLSTAFTLVVVHRVHGAEERLKLRLQVARIGETPPEPEEFYPDEETLAY